MRTPLIIAHRRNTRASIAAAITQGADGIEVDVRVHERQVILTHDPVTRSAEDLLRLEDLYELSRESVLIYLDFKDDAVMAAAEQIAARGALGRFVFFAESHETVRSLAAAKRRFPGLRANVSLRRSDLRDVERWFDGLPDYVQIEPWTGAETRLYLASRTRLAFDAMLSIDWLPAFARALPPWRPILLASTLIQTDYPGRWESWARLIAPALGATPALVNGPGHARSLLDASKAATL